MRARLRWLAPALLLAPATGPVPAQTTAPARPKAEHREDINRQFRDPKLDPRQYAKRFESESREVARRRRAIADAVGLAPGMAVADIGAGTGLFTRQFAERVGPTGKVYAVDIAPAFLEHIAARAKRDGQEGTIATVRGAPDSPNLPPGSIDVAFICDTYHHFEDPAAMLGAIRRALRPGGRLVVVELDRKPGASDFVKAHVRAEKAVFVREIEAAGFAPMDVANAPKLEENFFVMFRKVPAASPGRDGDPPR